MKPKNTKIEFVLLKLGSNWNKKAFFLFWSETESGRRCFGLGRDVRPTFSAKKQKGGKKGAGGGGIGASFESRSWTKEGTEIFFRDVKKIDSKKTFFFFGRNEISKIAEKESSQVEQNGSNLEICKNRQKLLLEPKCFSLKGQPVNLFQ